MTARARQLRIVALVVVAQALLGVLYLLVEQRRSSLERSDDDPLVAAPTAMNAPMPHLELRRLDGRTLVVAPPRRHTVLHFWATWCPPCRAELPALLSLPRRYPVDVVAVALDPNWVPVERFFDGAVDSQVVLGDAAQARDAWGVQTLPVTFLVSPQGHLVARFDGARRWSDRTFSAHWLQ